MRPTRICVLLAPEASEVDLERMEFAIQELDHPAQTARIPGALAVFVPPGRDEKRLEKEIAGAFADLELEAYWLPFRREEFDEDEGAWVDVGPGPRPQLPPPAPSPDRIRWRVRVTPHDAFHWREVRGEIDWLGRTIIEETGHELMVGAGDEQDAEALAAELRALPCVRAVSCKRLSWFARWRIRERLLGNYEGSGGL